MTPTPTTSEAPQPVELTVAYFRFGLSLFALWNPGALFGLPREPTEAAFLVGTVAVYNLFTGLCYARDWRARWRRQLMLLMDVVLISWWIRISGPDRQSLFAFYYIAVLMAAIWFKVFGALAMALVCSGLWVAIVGADEATLPPALIAPLPSLFMLAVLGGLVSEIHDLEHRKAQELRERVALYEQEIDLSREIQKLLRPESLPTLTTIELGAADRTSRTVGGGDYYDTLRLDDGRLAFCVADVAGKSIRAQSRLPLLKYALRAVIRDQSDPAVVVGELNRLLYDDLQPDLFITMLFGVVEEVSGRVRCCNAGHVAPIRYHANGSPPELFAAAGPALGLVPSARYLTEEFVVAAEQGLVVYTDGIVNAMHRVAGEFGEARLCHLIVQHRGDSAGALARAIVACVDDFEESTRTDDATVLVIRARRELGS